MRAHSMTPVPRLDDLDVRPTAGLQALVDRMLAKRVQDRFAAMEHVIEAIDGISADGDSRQPLTTPGTVLPQASSEHSSGIQVTVELTSVTLGVDLGGRFLAAAKLDEQGLAQPLNLGRENQALMRAAVASSDHQGAIFGDAALDHIRSSQGGFQRPFESLAKGDPVQFAGSQYPASLPTSLLLQFVKAHADGAENGREVPVQLTVTAPSAFGQVTRERLIHAAESCDFSVIRILDRNLAAALSQFNIDSLSARPRLAHSQGYWLVVSISDLSLEVSLLAVSPRRIQMLSVAGECDSGRPRWRRRIRRWLNRKMVKIDASDASRDPRGKFELNEQIDAAIDRLADFDEATIKFRFGGRNVRATLTAKTLLTCCMDLIQNVGELLADVLSESGVDGEDISCCLTVGTLARTQPVQNMLHNCGIDRTFVPIAQSDLAAAAAMLTRLGEMTPRVRPRLIPCVAHNLGLRMKAQDSRVTMVIPRLTTLPASVQQQLRFAVSGSQQVTLVESASTTDTRWIPFAEIELESPSSGTCESTFEVGEDGLVQCHVSAPKSHRAALDASSSAKLGEEVQRILKRTKAT